MNEGNGWISCWCYEAKSQVTVKGDLEQGSIAQILTVRRCNLEETCDQVFSSGCLIGKRLEGKFME